MEKSIVDILLVEDNPNDAELIIRSLQKHNLANRLHWVKDGEEALDYIFCRANYADRKSDLPRVVLLDLRLPKLDGIEVLTQIRNRPETHKLPVVVLTSSKEDQDLVQAYELGINSFVAKPVAFDEFAQTVANLGLYWVLVNRVPAEIRAD
jgi:two-component system, response regulator